MKKILIALFILSCASAVYALRIPRPLVLSYPITPEQVSQINRYLEDVWNMQGGRYEMDVATTPKTNAKNGEMWLVYTAPTVYIQYKANGHIYTMKPMGF